MKKILFITFMNTLLINAYSQNVGIGEENPQAKLHIKTSASEIMRLEGTNPYISFYDNAGYTGYIQSSNNTMSIASAGTNKLSLVTGFTERLTVLQNGNIGINNNNPSANFHVTSALGEAMRIQAPSAYLSFYDNANYTGYLQSSSNVMALASQGNNRLGLVTNFTERVTVLPNGNVGIGKANPNFKLDVEGNMNINGVVNLNNSPGASGNMLVSKGAGVAAGWANPTNSVYSSFVLKTMTGNPINPPIGIYTAVPDLNHSFTLTENTLVMITVNLQVRSNLCTLCPDSYVTGKVVIDGGASDNPFFVAAVHNDWNFTMNHSSAIKLTPGPHTIQIEVLANTGYPSILVFGGSSKMSLAFFKE